MSSAIKFYFWNVPNTSSFWQKEKIQFCVYRKQRLTRTACTSNNKWIEMKKKKKICLLPPCRFCRFRITHVYNFGYQTGNTRAIAVAPVRTILNRRVGFGSVCRSVRRSVCLCLSVASRKPRDRETLGRSSICTREDLPPARWETSAARSAL